VGAIAAAPRGGVHVRDHRPAGIGRHVLARHQRPRRHRRRLHRGIHPARIRRDTEGL